MGRRSSTRAARPPVSDSDASELPIVGLRQPCPCGSGRRYKACHGTAAVDPAWHATPFAGLPGEADWIAMRDIVPAATATVTLGVGAPGDRAGSGATVATLLPMSWPALVRTDGSVFVGLQTSTGSGDPSRDVADALLRALEAEPGVPIASSRVRAGLRLQDILDAAAPFEVTVHDGFDFWLEGFERSADVTESLERASTSIVPTVRLESVDAAYWCRIGSKEHLRWVLLHEEEALLDGLARLHASKVDGLGDGTRLLGTFRAHGRLAPVWDLAPGTEAAAVEEQARAFAERLGAALAESGPLSDEQRRARAGLTNRQVTLR